MKLWKTLFVATLLVGFASALPACNTVEGAGEDIEGTGDAIKDAAD